MRKPETIDLEKLKAAIADYSEAVENTKQHHAELEVLRSQIGILDQEINHLGLELKGLNANRATTIADIKQGVQRKIEVEREIEALRIFQTGLKRQAPSLEHDYNLADILNETAAKRQCWNIIYEGLLKSVDSELLKNIIAAGVGAGFSERTITNDLALDFEHDRLNALAKQFGLPL